MANNVTFRANFEQINEAALTKLQKLYSRFQDNDYNFGDMFVDGGEDSPTYEETNSRSWYIDNVGSKFGPSSSYETFIRSSGSSSPNCSASQ